MYVVASNQTVNPCRQATPPRRQRMKQQQTSTRHKGKEYHNLLLLTSIHILPFVLASYLKCPFHLPFEKQVHSYEQNGIVHSQVKFDLWFLESVEKEFLHVYRLRLSDVENAFEKQYKKSHKYFSSRAPGTFHQLSKA